MFETRYTAAINRQSVVKIGRQHFKTIATVATLLAGLASASCSQAEVADVDLAPIADTQTDVVAGPVRRCVNLGNALDAPYEGAWSYVIKDQHILDIASAGFDTIRVPIRWSAHADEAPPYRIDDQFMARVDHVVSLALSQGLQVIVNVHHYEELMQAPEAHRERLIRLWEQIADHFSDRSDQLIFEVLNEPVDKLDNARMRTINRDVLRVIRDRSATRWVIVSGDRWGSLEGLMNAAAGLPQDDRTIWSFHSYHPYEFTHQGAPWAAQPMRTGVRWGSARERQEIMDAADGAAQLSRDYGHPVFLGEFGVFPAAPRDDRVAWTRFMRRVAEANGFGWCHWDFAASFPIYDEARGEFVPDMLGALMGE